MTVQSAPHESVPQWAAMASVLVPSRSGVHLEVIDTGFLEILGGGGFDLVSLLIAYSRSSEVDWA